MRIFVGTAASIPPSLANRWPELAQVRWRRGGLPLRVGGWCLGRATVSGITLGRTVWLAPGVPWDPELLLHEARHVHQWGEDPFFPMRYILESVWRGYQSNRYEVDARQYAARRLVAPDGPSATP